MSTSSEIRSKLRHAAWNAHRRCTNVADAHYVDYGGRGIRFMFPTVELCVDYLFTLSGHDDLTLWIDRIDNNGHYEVGNIQFTTRSNSQRNRRRSRPEKNNYSLIPYFVKHGFGRCFKKLVDKGTSPRSVAELYCVSRQTVCRVIGRYR